MKPVVTAFEFIQRSVFAQYVTSVYVRQASNINK